MSCLLGEIKAGFLGEVALAWVARLPAQAQGHSWRTTARVRAWKGQSSEAHLEIVSQSHLASASMGCAKVSEAVNGPVYFIAHFK